MNKTNLGLLGTNEKRVLVAKLDERVRWNALRLLYRLLAGKEAQAIVRHLLQEERIRSSDLLRQTGLSESQFHPVMKQLVKFKIVDKTVKQDRSVIYSLSLFGKNVLKLSEPLLDEIKETIGDELLKEA